MTLNVHVKYTDGETGFDATVGGSDSAMEAVRFSFNPSGIHHVNVLKALAAAFLSKCDEVAVANPAAAREIAVAKTNMQTASMWSVLGATKGA